MPRAGAAPARARRGRERDEVSRPMCKRATASGIVVGLGLLALLTTACNAPPEGAAAQGAGPGSAQKLLKLNH